VNRINHHSQWRHSSLSMCSLSAPTSFQCVPGHFAREWSVKDCNLGKKITSNCMVCCICVRLDELQISCQIKWQVGSVILEINPCKWSQAPLWKAFSMVCPPSPFLFIASSLVVVEVGICKETFLPLFAFTLNSAYSITLFISSMRSCFTLLQGLMPKHDKKVSPHSWIGALIILITIMAFSIPNFPHLPKLCQALWHTSKAVYCHQRNFPIHSTTQQQQLSHLSQVFGVGYMNQKRITLNRAYGSGFSTHSYRAICLH